MVVSWDDPPSYPPVALSRSFVLLPVWWDMDGYPCYLALEN